MSGLKLGDQVYWTSQSGGYSSRKNGEIIEVVPADKLPTQHEHLDTVLSRGHESYIVRAGRTLTSKGKTYWPRVSQIFKDAPSKIHRIRMICIRQNKSAECLLDEILGVCNEPENS